MLRTLTRNVFWQQSLGKQIQSLRYLAHYPIDETIFGLNEEQIKVIFLHFLFICHYF